MEFLSSLFGHKEDEIRERISSLSGSIADANIFPSRLLQERSRGLPFSQQFEGLVSDFSTMVKTKGIEVVLSEIGELAENLRMIPPLGETFDEDESLSLKLITYCVHKMYPVVDDYVNWDFEGSRVHRALESIPLEKEGLVKLDGRFTLKEQGLVYQNKHLVYYHPYLRRHFTSNFAGIYQILQEANSDNSMEVQVAIDPSRISVPEFHRNIVELDYWRGPLFSVEKLNSSKFVGLTKYTRGDSAGLDDITCPLERTDFLISDDREGNKVIEIEEISPIDRTNYSDKYHIHRYAHMIWNSKVDAFIHFDVSVKIYDKELHLKRLNSDWRMEHQPKSKKKKLFRVDGRIPSQFVIESTSTFFRYNEMINEFFEGKGLEGK